MVNEVTAPCMVVWVILVLRTTHWQSIHTETALLHNVFKLQAGGGGNKLCSGSIGGFIWGGDAEEHINRCQPQRRRREAALFAP